MFVPDGDFAVNTLEVDVSSARGIGRIVADNGSLISVSRLLETDKLAQRKMMEPFLVFREKQTQKFILMPEMRYRGSHIAVLMALKNYLSHNGLLGQPGRIKKEFVLLSLIFMMMEG